MIAQLDTKTPRFLSTRCGSAKQAGTRWYYCISALSLALCGGNASAEMERNLSPSALRTFIDRQVGGIGKLMVPATDADIPVPSGPPAQPNRYETSEAKRYLGKMLFHDPIRTARVNINQAQPLDLPDGTAFGGTVNGADDNIQAIVDATKQTGSCGSCHIGEAAGKAGQLLNFNTGGEGRGYTDRDGNFVPRRRPQAILTKVRDQAIFPGDLMVDSLPTLTDIFIDAIGQRLVTTPALFYHEPPPTELIATGRLDQLDSVGRLSPSMVGFAFNNRLLFGGFAGEPQSTPGSLNPFSDPAHENLTLLLLDAHRMIGFQAAELAKFGAYRKLFRDAFPEEAAQAPGCVPESPPAPKACDNLINDPTVFRATATFLRTVVTRNTPFDQFLGGDNRALTPAQRRGARLFFTPAAGRAGGAGCFECHSGPMLNKQPDDPDVTGVGALIEENFFNIGIGDHPGQALNALARNRLDPIRMGADGFPYHAEDTGRQEVTHNTDDAFKFRSLTLRQLKDGRQFFHNGSFTKVRDVVDYFNAGIPQDLTAGTALTLSERFTHPRGAEQPSGLGLSQRQVDDLTDFLENALYDPALVNYDPKSTTDTLQPNVRDLSYSKYRPDLAILGARDGFMPSGLAIDDNDPLARRDQGLEFLDVTDQATIELMAANRESSLGRRGKVLKITNRGDSAIDTHLLVVVKQLPKHVRLRNATGTSRDGDPYLRLFLPNGELLPGKSLRVALHFGGRGKDGPMGYSLTLLSGQGSP